MNFLYLLTEVLANGYKVEILDVLSLLSMIFGILVIISKNPIISVLFLIGLFFTIAGYLILIGVSFIGLSYLLVYVGAVSILFLFILMLINVRISELFSETSNAIPLAFIITLCFNSFLSNILPYSLYSNNSNLSNITDSFQNIYTNNENLTYVTSSSWDSSLAQTSHITSIGNIMYTNYSIWLIITSIILLLAMVGAIVITLKPNYVKKTNNLN